MHNNLTGKNFIAGELSALGSAEIRGFDPSGNSHIEPPFFNATTREIEDACKAASEAAEEFRSVPSSRRAAFLRAIGSELEARSEAAIERAQLESGLPKGRLTGELGRTTGQLRMFASLIEEGSWVDARIERANPERSPAPKPDLRRMLRGIGPVAVFGASNFPFAFSVAGGDTASALAAGCPVIVKAHPAHPGTSEFAAQAIEAAVESSGMPRGVFSMVHGGVEVGQHLVIQPELEAVAFTGSFGGGMALARTVSTRSKPIPVFAEMGSTNPIFVLPDAIESQADQEKFAAGYVQSLTLGVGQFCTNPGLLFGYGTSFRLVCELIQESLAGIQGGAMLTSGIAEKFKKSVAHLRTHPSVNSASEVRSVEGCQAVPTFIKLSAAEFSADPIFLEEVFGPFGIGVEAHSAEELLTLISTLPGQLTATLHTSGANLAQSKEFVSKLSQFAGRVIFNGFPTGVEVNSAMQHGGPFPATLDSKFTSVGTAAIFRFARPIAFQDVPDLLLPKELQESNPLGIRRMVERAY